MDVLSSVTFMVSQVCDRFRRAGITSEEDNPILDLKRDDPEELSLGNRRFRVYIWVHSHDIPQEHRECKMSEALLKFGPINCQGWWCLDRESRFLQWRRDQLFKSEPWYKSSSFWLGTCSDFGFWELPCSWNACRLPLSSNNFLKLRKLLFCVFLFLLQCIYWINLALKHSCWEADAHTLWLIRKHLPILYFLLLTCYSQELSMFHKACNSSYRSMSGRRSLARSKQPT